MMDKIFGLRLYFYGLGAVLVFSGPRYFKAYDELKYLLAIAVIFMCLSLMSSVMKLIVSSQKSRSEEYQIFRLSCLWQGGGLLGALLYLLHDFLTGLSSTPDAQWLQVLAIASFAVTVLSALSGLGVELGIRQTGRREMAESSIVIQSGQSFLGVGFLLLALIGLNFIANKKNSIFDWTYLKASSPGAASSNMLKANEIEVEIGLFFERESEVEPYVREYFEKVSAISSKVKVSHYSKDFNPIKAESFRVARNGQIVLMKGNLRQRIDIGENISQARKKLSKLDQLFLGAFLKLTDNPKVIYVSAGHGEMTWKGDVPSSRSIKNLEKILRSSGYLLRTLPGLAGTSTIPKDADLLMIPGPSRSFTEQELQSLGAYLQEGGRMAAFLDIEFSGGARQEVELLGGNGLIRFIADRGIVLEPEVLANDRQFVRNTGRAIDHYFTFTNKFSSHESVRSLSQKEDKMGVLTFQSGFLTQGRHSGKSWQATTIMESLASTFIDENKNMKFDRDEERRSRTLGMVSEGDGSKITVFSDATMISDPLFLNPGNQLLVLDTIKWLLDQNNLLGDVSSEEDVKIRHSKGRELLVFHGSIIFMPLAVLVLGFLMIRRQKEV